MAVTILKFSAINAGFSPRRPVFVSHVEPKVTETFGDFIYFILNLS